MIRLRRRARSAGAGRRLFDSAVRQSRTTELYTGMGAPDTIEGRFELLTLFVILLIESLRGLGDEGAASSQGVFDAYVRDLDGALREMGVGDLSVGKRMRELGGAFYGRAAAYREALKTLPERSALEDLVARTILAGMPDASPEALTDYIVRCHGALAEQASLLTDDPRWPEARA